MCGTMSRVIHRILEVTLDPIPHVLNGGIGVVDLHGGSLLTRNEVEQLRQVGIQPRIYVIAESASNTGREIYD